VYSIGVPNKEPAKADVLQGTLDIMILQALATLGPSHGYAIAARLEQASGGRVQLNMGTLFPGLMGLEQRSCISGTWGVTDTTAGPAFTRLPLPAAGSSPSRNRNRTGR
jgi:PadR family transcriptional regulator, regulatory protein PadR